MSKHEADKLLTFMRDEQQTFCMYGNELVTADELMTITLGKECEYEEAINFITKI